MHTKPPRPGLNQVHVKLTGEMVEAIDRFAAAQRFAATRSDVIRMALRRFLELEGLFAAQTERQP